MTTKFDVESNQASGEWDQSQNRTMQRTKVKIEVMVMARVRFRTELNQVEGKEDTSRTWPSNHIQAEAFKLLEGVAV